MMGYTYHKTTEVRAFQLTDESFGNRDIWPQWVKDEIRTNYRMVVDEPKRAIELWEFQAYSIWTIGDYFILPNIEDSGVMAQKTFESVFRKAD